MALGAPMTPETKRKDDVPAWRTACLALIVVWILIWLYRAYYPFGLFPPSRGWSVIGMFGFFVLLSARPPKASGWLVAIPIISMMILSISPPLSLTPMVASAALMFLFFVLDYRRVTSNVQSAPQGKPPSG